jgi:hypothetical protein
MSFFASQRIKNEGLLESYFIYHGKTLEWEIFCHLNCPVMFISQLYGIHKAKKNPCQMARFANGYF